MRFINNFRWRLLWWILKWIREQRGMVSIVPFVTKVRCGWLVLISLIFHASCLCNEMLCRSILDISSPSPPPSLPYFYYVIIAIICVNYERIHAESMLWKRHLPHNIGSIFKPNGVDEKCVNIGPVYPKIWNSFTSGIDVCRVRLGPVYPKIWINYTRGWFSSGSA